jgi:hypothetical protein
VSYRLELFALIRISIILVGAAFLVGEIAGSAQDKTGGNIAARKEMAEPYEGFKSDQALLRKHIIHKGRDGGKDTTASSAKAIDAAQRIFSRVSFLFRSREEVLNLLGDPATVSDYGQPAGTDPSSPLVYVFDTGLWGLKFTISFNKHGPPRVEQVHVDFLN